MSFNSMKKLCSSKEGTNEFLDHFRYILCDHRLKGAMIDTFGSSRLAKNHIIPVVVKDVPIETLIKNIRLMLKSYPLFIRGTCVYACLVRCLHSQCKIGRTKMENSKISANYNAV